jgi:hypothetical protein
MCPHTTIYVSTYYYVSSYYYICVRILLHVSAYYCCGLIGEKNLWIVKPGTLLNMCPHTTIYVSAYYYICVRILLLCVDRQERTRGSRQARFSALYVSAYCVLILCLHTTMYVSSYYCICVLILLCVLIGETNSWISSSQVLCYICVRILCPHTVAALLQLCCSSTIYVSAYCVLILLCMCPHTATYVSSYCCVCVLTLLYMCPHTAIYLSSYYYDTKQKS